MVMKYKEDYIDLHDFFEGERKVKSEGQRYTPKLEGQDLKRYQEYVSFGILYNALARTRQGLKGAILRKPVDIQFPENLKPILDTIMKNGSSIYDVTRDICDAVLGYGRIGAMVDIDVKGQPYISLYDAANILDTEMEENKKKIILREIIEKPEPAELRRHLELINNTFIVTVYQRDDNGELVKLAPTKNNPNPRIPKYKGKPLNFIPFTFFGSSSNTPEPSRPPLLDLLNILKGHWRLTVAYQYGLHFAALPTPCFAGFNFEEGQAIALGPGAAHHSPDSAAKSWFLQTGGAGLADIEHGLDRLEKQMAIVGARLLEGQKASVEAAETIRLRSSGDTATLSDIAGNIENGLTKVLQKIGFWLGVPAKNCRVSVNKDFVSARLTPQEITSLLQAVQAGQMSEETFIYNLQAGEILQAGRTIEQEIEAINEDRKKKTQQGWA